MNASASRAPVMATATFVKRAVAADAWLPTRAAPASWADSDRQGRNADNRAKHSNGRQSGQVCQPLFLTVAKQLLVTRPEAERSSRRKRYGTPPVESIRAVRKHGAAAR